MIKRNFAIALLASFALGAAPLPALAQTSDYPGKPIRLIVPFAAGGGSDIIARLIGQKLADAWGKPIVVENKVGASGFIGADYVAKQAGDGYTILISISSVHAIAQHLYPHLPFDPFKDFAPVTQIALSPMALLVNPETPARNLAGFIAYAKSKHGLNYGTFGTGSGAHLTGELLNRAAALTLAQVPYKGEALALVDLVGGQIPAAFITVTVAKPQIVAGKARALAVIGTRRSQALPDVPTFLESGYPGLESVGWFALFAPAGTPRPIIDKLSAKVAAIVHQPEVTARLIELGAEPMGNTPREFAANWRADSDRYAEIIHRANIKLDP